jgi:hypothetical protein
VKRYELDIEGGQRETRASVHATGLGRSDVCGTLMEQSAREEEWDSQPTKATNRQVIDSTERSQMDEEDKKAVVKG